MELIAEIIVELILAGGICQFERRQSKRRPFSV